MPTDDEGESELGDFIEDEDSLAPDEEVTSSMLREVLRYILQDLPPREVRILQLARYASCNCAMGWWMAKRTRLRRWARNWG
jgi:DNA-directed RNA polymerase sigma subunit (sigma70/sigma32)